MRSELAIQFSSSRKRRGECLVLRRIVGPLGPRGTEPSEHERCASVSSSGG